MVSGVDGINPDANYLVELRGCEFVIKEWIKIRPYDVLTIYDSDKFLKFMKQEIQD